MLPLSTSEFNRSSDMKLCFLMILVALSRLHREINIYPINLFFNLKLHEDFQRVDGDVTQCYSIDGDVTQFSTPATTQW